MSDEQQDPDLSRLLGKMTPAQAKSSGKDEQASSSPAAVVDSWLLAALRDGPVSVSELQARAQRAGLLRADQSLGQARIWRNARAALGVMAFQRLRAWHWQLPPLPSFGELINEPALVGPHEPVGASPVRDPGSEVPEETVKRQSQRGASSAASTMASGELAPASGLEAVGDEICKTGSEYSKALQVEPEPVAERTPGAEPPPEAAAPEDAVERPAIVRVRVIDPAAEILAEWARDVARLDWRRPSGGIPQFRWSLFCDDAAAFLVGDFSLKAARLGWSTYDIFGLACDRPMERRDLAGLCWALQHGRVVELWRDSATCVRGSSVFHYARKCAEVAVMWLPWKVRRDA